MLNNIKSANDYIYYGYGDLLAERSGDVSAGRVFLEREFSQHLAMLEAESLKRTLAAGAWEGDSQAIMGLFGDLTSLESSMSQVLNDVAAAINAKIQESASLRAAYTTARDVIGNAQANYRTMLEDSVDLTKLRSMFASIDRVLLAIGQQPLDRKLTEALLQWVNGADIAVTTMKAYQRHASIYDLMMDTLQQARTYKKISGNQVSGMISNVFNGYLGELVAQYILEGAFSAIAVDVDNVVKEVLVSDKWVNVGAKFSSDVDQKKVRSKVDLMNTGALKITLSSEGKQASLIIDANASVKWKSGQNKVVTVESRTPLSTMLPVEGSNQRWFIENILAHKGYTSGKYQSRRRGKAATDGKMLSRYFAAQSFVSLAQGKGGGLGGGIDNAELFVIQGKVYSMADLMRRIVERYNGQDVIKTDPFGVSTSPTISNAWKGNSQQIDMGLAQERSKDVRAQINALVLSAHFNPNFIKTLL